MNGVEPVSNSKNMSIYFENSIQAKQHIFAQAPLKNNFISTRNSKAIENFSYIMTAEIK